MRWVSKTAFFFFLWIPKEPFIYFAAQTFSVLRGGDHHVEEKLKNRIADKVLIGGEEVEARLAAFLSEEAYAAAFMGSKRGSSLHA